MIQNINNNNADIKEQINFGNIDATNLTEIDIDDLFKAPEREHRNRVVSLWVTDSVANKVQQYETDLKKREEIIPRLFKRWRSKDKKRG